jgi:hypothetical protein
MKNEIFQTIFTIYESDIERLYHEESACLIIFRILPKNTQQVIMRLINIDSEVNLNLQTLIKDINWSDILENHETGIKEVLRLLHFLKIFNKDNMVMNNLFKFNMLNILGKGISAKTAQVVPKKKAKSWNTIYEKSIKLLEKYLIKLYEFDNATINLDSYDDKIKFLVDSGLVKKVDGTNTYKLQPIAYKTLLSDRQTQIRYLVLRYIIKHKGDDKESFFRFLNLIFSLCTLDVGIVIPLNTAL